MRLKLKEQLSSYLKLFACGLMTIGLLFGTTLAADVDHLVSGTVSSAEDGSPMAGVAVLIKGTTFGAYTDGDGKYTVNAPDENSVLVFSFIGFATLEEPINGRSTVDVALESSVSTLDEVVVTGYGTQTAKEVTSSIVSVKAEDFNKGNVQNVEQLLQGKVAGLTIARPGGNPNGGFNIRLRGLSTLGGNTQPLIVIDGVIGADLNSVDPNDIASIDVLKDGSAAAIYGTRGSSGVILVTTKSGELGRTQVDYNGFVTLEEIGKSVSVMSADEYRSLPLANNLGSETDWFDELTRTGVTHVHNVSMSGGTAQTTYRASANFRDAQGVAENTGFQQIITRLNLTQRAFDDRLRLTLNLGGTLRDSDFGFDEAFRYATIYNPTAPVRSNDPSFDIYDGYFQQVLFDYYNPVAILEQNINQGETKRINANIEGEFEILPGLKLLGRYSQNRTDRNGNQYWDKQSFWVGRDRNGLATKNFNTAWNELMESTLTYNTTFGTTDVTVMGGYSYQGFRNEGFSASGGNFLTDAFAFNSLQSSLDFPNGLGSVSSFKNSSKLVGYFGRLNLNFGGTYFLNASYRREGSSTFGDGNKWGDFYAVSGGVTLSNLFDIASVDNLKLRVSYGRTGNLPPGSYISLLRLGPAGNFFFNGEYVPSFAPTSNPNPNLKWETKDEINVGIDFALLNERLTGSLDWYTRQTNDLIFDLPVPVPPNLVGTSTVNVGEIDNTGVELALNYLVVDKPNFSWSIGGNISTFKTELVSLSNPDEGLDFGSFRLLANLGSPGQNNTPTSRAEEGEEIGLLWGKVYQGVEGGKWVFQDLNGDGVINDDDEAVIGNGLPDAEIGINNSFTFGNFDLNFFLRGAFGHDLVNTFRAFYEVANQAGSYNVVKTDFFDPSLDDSPLYNSIHVEDADFIKLDNATLGYTLDLPESSPFRNMRFYVSGQNLFFITDYTGVDPEVRFDDGGNNLSPGIDRRNTWFRTRAYTFGVNVGL